MTIDDAINVVSNLWHGQGIYDVLVAAKAQGETLTRCQAECTRLLLENRRLEQDLLKAREDHRQFMDTLTLLGIPVQTPSSPDHLPQTPSPDAA